MDNEKTANTPQNQPPQAPASHDGILIACTAVLGCLFVIGFIYQILVSPSEVIPLVALAGAFVVDMFVLVSCVVRKMSRDKAEKARQYEDLYNAQKASYLVLRRSFDELTEKLDRMGESGSIPAEEIINAQKALAKVTINRSKENADALMNSNDEMIKAFDSIQGMVDSGNDALFDKQKALFDGVSADIKEQTREITAQNKELDRKLTAMNEEVRSLKHQVASLETAQRQVAAQPVMMAFQAMPQMQGMQPVPVQPMGQPYVQPAPAPAPMPEPAEEAPLPEDSDDLFSTDDTNTDPFADTDSSPSMEAGTEEASADTEAIPDEFDLSAGEGGENAFDLSADAGSEDLFASDETAAAEEAPAAEDTEAIPDEFDLSADSGDGLDLFADEKVPDVDESLTEEAPADDLSLDGGDELSLDDFPDLSADSGDFGDTEELAPAEEEGTIPEPEEQAEEELHIEEEAAEAPAPEVVAEEAAAPEPAPAPEPEPAPAAAPEPEPAPEPAPALDLSSSGVDLSDPNAKMSADDIAALFAAANGGGAAAPAPEPEPAPAATPDPEPAPAPEPEPAPAPTEPKEIDLSGAGVDLSDPNKQLSPDEIAKLFASVQ